MNLLVVGALMVTMQDSAGRWAPLARALDSAVAARAFPGAVVVVGRHDTILYQHAFGHLTYTDGPRAGGPTTRVTTRTVYDIASLTKVVGLTTAMMQLVEEGSVGLDTPAVHYVPAFHDSTVTVRQLLTHSSGLPAWKPFFQSVRPGAGTLARMPEIDSLRARMFALVNAEPLEAAPGARMAYSDVGAMALTQIVEHVMHERIDTYLNIHLMRPLGMRDTRYRPPASWRSRIAPTERDTTYRHRLVHGEVHDENAWSMGGISGHAGLFSTGPDLAKFAQLMLRTLRGESSSRLVDSATVELFTRVQQPGFSSRALGWDTPSENSSAGTRLSPRAFGHTGFTGTSLWIDPGQDLFVILLTNRVYPTRENTGIFAARREVADLAVGLAGPR
jgi:CubicO group peptidase (beta-lactamase class C family)